MSTQADSHLADNADYHRLRTLPGVGPVIALIILAESGDLRRFSHHRQYLKFCGFDLSSSQSGQSHGRCQLSKRGNARLRYAFWLAVTSAIRQRENSFRWKFERYIWRDPDDADLKRKAYTAVAAKMARVAHSLIKHYAATTRWPSLATGLLSSGREDLRDPVDNARSRPPGSLCCVK